MNQVRGMSVKQFYDTVNEMRKVYSFKDDVSYLDDFRELTTGYNRQVCIHTIDEETGVEVVLCKGVEREVL